ncbi:hypothetical protein HY212_06150 [Candidatus Pacearchaeota archaeon]|nr:hypothetical protein [Candidatus Pacearchaeota archaeon]
MRWRYKSSRRGITTIVTSAIMLVAVAIMGSGVVLWGNSNIFSNERTLASSYSVSVNKISENLVIEKIWFGTNPQKFVNITLNNQGSVGLNVTQIQLSNSSKTIQYHFGNQTILPQKSGSIQISYGYNHDVLTNIQITTTRGSIFTTQVLTP